MFSRSSDPEEKRRLKDEKKAEVETKNREAALTQRRQAFWSSPRGLARIAKLAGQSYFQIELSLAETARTWSSRAYGEVATQTSRVGGQGAVLTDIEAEGWELINSGWIFQETGAVSRDKLLSSGQSVQTTGRTVGIYLFRSDESEPRTDPDWVGSPPGASSATAPSPRRPIWTSSQDDGLGDFDQLR